MHASPESQSPSSPAPKKRASAARFSFACSRCESVLEALRSQSNLPARCPTCGVVFRIPLVDGRTGLASGGPEITPDLEDPTPIHAYAAAGEQAPEIVTAQNGERAIVCPRCRYEGGIDRDYCERCGFPFTMDGAHRAGASGVNAWALWSFLLAMPAALVCLFHDLSGAVLASISALMAWSALNRISLEPSQGGKNLAIAALVFATAGLLVIAVKQS